MFFFVAFVASSVVASTTSATPPSNSASGSGDGGSGSGSSEKVMQPPEELPYFPEKWPGKVCALCCLGERSQMGQGEMLQIELTETEPKVATPSTPPIHDSPTQMNQEEDRNPRSALNAQTQISNRRQKGHNKCKYVDFSSNRIKSNRIKMKQKTYVYIALILCHTLFSYLYFYYDALWKKCAT